MQTYEFTAFRNERTAAYGTVPADSPEEAKAKILERFYEKGPELEFDSIPYIESEAPDHFILTDEAGEEYHLEDETPPGQTNLFTLVPDQSATTHTPGPWRVFDIFTDLEIVTDSPTAAATESLVQFKGQRNARANARLMAAAPELLECLAWLMNEAIPDSTQFTLGFLPEDKRDGYRKCAAVLAKVRVAG